MSFWDFTTDTQVQDKAPVKRGGPMVFEVGEGLSPEQTKKAYQKITEPDYEMENARDGSFWGIVSNTITGIVKPTPTPIRRAFEAEETIVNAPPILTVPAEFGYRLLEILPRAVAKVGGEFKAGFKPAEVEANIDLRRFGFDTPNYVTAAKRQQDAINNGENPWISGLSIVSNDTLDIAFGAQLTSDLAKLSTKILLAGGVEARIEAQNIVDAFRGKQDAALKRIKGMSDADWGAKLAEKEKVLADLANAKKQAQKILAEEGSPTAADYARVNTARYTEVLSRDTPIKSGFWGEFSKPNITPRARQIEAAAAGTLQLPGTRERPGQAPAFGLSTKEVESVGGVGKGSQPLASVDAITKELERIETGLGKFFLNTIAGKNMSRADTLQLGNEIVNNFKMEAAEGGNQASIFDAPKQGSDIVPSTGNVGIEPSPTLHGIDTKNTIRLTPEAAEPIANLASQRYWNEVVNPAKQSGQAQIIGSDDIKDYFGKDYNVNNHPVYSKAADSIYKRAVSESIAPVVKYTVGGAGSGKSDFLVPDMAKDFNGVVYDSTGWNYEGIKKQIDYARAQGKTPKVYAAVTDLERARAYTFLREAKGEHPVREVAFIKTHVGAVDTLKRLIKDGVDVYVVDTRNITDLKGIETIDYEKNPIALLDGLGYNESNVKQRISKLSKENAEEFIRSGAYDRGGKEEARGVSQKDGPDKVVSKADKVNEAAERAKAGEDFGPRETTNISQYEQSGAVTMVDRLIAEGKIRIVSRKNRDTFQIKKGTKWVNVRDDESAVKQLINKYKPKPKVYSEADTEKIEINKVQLEIVRDILKEHPAKKLLQFIDRKEGEFLDFRNPNLAKTQREAEQIKAKNKKIMRTAESAFQDNPELHDRFDNQDTIKEVIDDYKEKRIVEKSLVATKKFLAETLVAIKKQVMKPPTAKPLDTFTGEGRSLEILIEQAQSVLAGGDIPIEPGFPFVIEKTVTPLAKKVHILDYMRTPHFVMEKIGFGKQAGMLREGMDSYLKELPGNIEKVSNWLKRLKTKEAQLDVYRWLDGKAITLPPNERIVADEIRNYLQDWAKRLNLPDDKRISRYINHVFSDEIIEKEFDEDLAKLITDKIPEGTYNPFLLERLGKKGYIEDLGMSLDAYTKRATRKAHMDPALEAIRSKAGVQLEFSNIEKSQFRYVQKYIDAIQMRPSDWEEGVDNLVKSVIGYKYGQRPTIRTLKFLRQMTYRGLLGLNPASALRNLSQGINTYSQLGEKYTTLGYLNLFNRGAAEELEKEGVLNAGFVEDRVLSSTKRAVQMGDKVLFAFFSTAEKINRGAAYFGAKRKYLSTHAKEYKGAPVRTEKEAVEYAKSIVRKTQFAFDTVDTPVALSGEIMKTIFQLQTYTTKQIEFLFGMAKGSVKGGEKAKNFIGLLRYSLAGMAFVYTIGKAFGMEPKELLPWYRFDTPPSLKLPTEAVKAVVGAPDKYGNERTLGEKFTDVGKAALPLIPAGAQMKKVYEGYGTVKQGGSFDKGNKLQFKQGDSMWKDVQSILFGKYASSEAKDYFNRAEIKKEEQKPVRKIYDQVQKLKAEDKEDEAQALVDALSDDDYETYKDIRAGEKTKTTNEGKKAMFPIYLEIQDLISEGREVEATAMLDAMTDEEYRYYKLIKDQNE